jgi:hypothetical protein
MGWHLNCSFKVGVWGSPDAGGGLGCSLECPLGDACWG